MRENEPAPQLQVDSEKNHSKSSGRNANQTSLSVPYPVLNLSIVAIKTPTIHR